MISGLMIRDWHDGLHLLFLAPFSPNLLWLTMGPCGIVPSFLVPTLVLQLDSQQVLEKELGFLFFFPNCHVVLSHEGA